MSRTSSHRREVFADLLDFVEARAAEDTAGTCRLCPRDIHLVDVGTMARAWVRRVRRSEPTPRQLACTAWIAGIHGDHRDYRRAWEQLQSEPPEG